MREACLGSVGVEGLPYAAPLLGAAVSGRGTYGRVAAPASGSRAGRVRVAFRWRGLRCGAMSQPSHLQLVGRRSAGSRHANRLIQCRFGPDSAPAGGQAR